MIPGGHLELVGVEAGTLGPDTPSMATDKNILTLSASNLANALAWLPGQVESRPLRERCQSLTDAFKPFLAELQALPPRTGSDDVRLLQENFHLLQAELSDACGTFQRPHRLPLVRVRNTVIPRITAIADDYLAAAAYKFSPGSFTDYVQAFQEVTVLNMAELWMLILALKIALLEQTVSRGSRALRDPEGSYDIASIVRSLREIRQTTWKVVIEPLIRFDRILREDPAGAYSRMDYDTRELYRSKLVRLADHSDCSEMEIAQDALALAREAQKHPDSDPRVTLRRSHVGTYLLGEGTPLLKQRANFRAPIGERFRTFLLDHPDEIYLPGIAVVSLLIVLGTVLLLTDASTPLGLVLLSTLAVLLPGSQSAVQIVNYLVTLALPAQILPKLDFSEGLPSDCVTLVAIPTLLLNEAQVHKLVDDLEVRFLGNHDPNLHFALLTDLPDSPEKPPATNSLVDLCSELIRGLNEKYPAKETGSFFLLHRHPVYNSRERLWMGWERKRGKLMDLNNLLRAQFDSFPVKIGDLSRLPSMRFVITLDADTELPRGS